MGRVVVVGSVNVDLVVSVERLPRAGETVAGGTYGRHGGGKGANQAVAAARAGADVTMVAAVGADEMGEEALAELAAEGIDTAHVARLDDAPTGVAVIVVDEAGENQIAVASGANAALDAATVERALAALLERGSRRDDAGRSPAAEVARGVVLLSNEVPEAVVVAAIEAARAAGWLVVLNPAPARPAEGDRSGVVVTPNADEARELTGEEDVGPAARMLAARTSAPVLVTLGAEGALLLDGGEARRLPAPAVDVVDTTGAGDTVNGALAAELAAARPLEDAVRYALAAAALSTRAAGARTGMPRRDEVLASL
jgi:ribokinase